jgi:long-chain acyl-CoA synthetase
VSAAVETNVADWLDRRLRAHPRWTALAERRGYRTPRLSYGELDDQVQRRRRVFHGLGLRRGDRVILIGANSTAWVSTFLACIESGLTAVPLDPHSPESLVRAVRDETEAALTISQLPVEGPGRALVFGRLEELAAEASAERLAPAPAEPGDLLEIVYTSGTTGRPKGVMVTHANLLANLEGLASTVWLPPFLRFVSTLPLSHMLEQVLGLLLPLSRGCSVLYPDTTHPSRLLRLVREHRVHAMITVPGLLKAMKGAMESSGLPPWKAMGLQFRLIGVGGAALPADVERWWSVRGVRLVQGYGLTEATPIVALNSPWRLRRGSLGRPLPGVSVTRGEGGELRIRGVNATPGYYRQPEKTRALFDDGWLMTGDIGELHGDWLYFRGRSKDVIVTASGANVYPEDIEPKLNELPGVRDSCVLQWRDKVWAVLLLSESADTAAILAEANSRLMPHQKVSGATEWPHSDFPRTPMGKVRKFQVLEELKGLETPGPSPSAPAGGTPLDRILLRLAADRRIERGATLGQLGLDSLDRVALLSDIEQELGVELEETAVGDSTTVARLESLVAGAEKPLRAPEPDWPFGAAAALTRTSLGWLPRAWIVALARPTCEGIDRLRGLRGPVIFAVNHQSAWDGGLVHHFLPRGLKRCAFPALPDFFGLWSEPKGPLSRLAWRGMGLFIGMFYRCYPFGAAAGTQRSFERTGRLLDRGYSIMIFPEGGRTPDGRIHKFMSGVGVLAKEMAVPIVPVRISGMHEILPFPRYVVPRGLGRARIVFGAPILPDDGADPDTAAEAIQRAVESL